MRRWINNNVLNIAVVGGVVVRIDAADSIIIVAAGFVGHVERSGSWSSGPDLMPSGAIDVDVVYPPADRERDAKRLATVKTEAELKRCPLISAQVDLLILHASVGGCR